MTLREKVQQRIAMAPHGTPFLAKDFLDLGPYESVRKVLPWMARDGEIRRIVHGVYDRPYYSELLKEYQAPKMDELAHALARNFNWTIAPSGATAANLLGISTQIPAHWEYISDGPYRSYDVQGITLFFLHRNNRSITALSPKTILVIEALKHMGERQEKEENDRIVALLSQALSKEEATLVLQETMRSSLWIHDIMRKVAAEHED